MPTERPIEPALAQRVEEVRDALRAEQRALGPLPQERDRLQAELERLQTRKQELHREVEALRAGQPAGRFQLPATLSAPFEIKVPRSLGGSALELLSVGVFASALFLTQGGLEFWPLAAAVFGICAALLFLTALMPPRWRFGTKRVKLVGISERDGDVHYKDILDVQVLVTPAQRRRGVGTVVVTCPAETGNSTDLVLIRNVPEPERLAEWLRAQAARVTAPRGA